ncbi:hypothetical protein [Haloarchaeobius sp. DYHT-AS-18]|uniref:hypothetical protein n=1 Tax=Haloarchaeobius sp. DYHT-AS-18 TaxID=3446117 RepID=UPI003EBCF105
MASNGTVVTSSDYPVPGVRRTASARNTEALVVGVIAGLVGGLTALVFLELFLAGVWVPLLVAGWLLRR